jgi:PKHD-type hydroxylase
MSSLTNNMYWFWEGALSKEFCNFALAEIDWTTAKAGGVNVDNPIVDPKQRRTDVIWQDFMQPLGCIARAYIDIANQAAGWNYALTSQEQTQIGWYKNADSGHYDWHIDATIPKDGVQRKLSISILLSDPSDFEGGELQFKGIEDRKILTKQGSIVVFPSFIEHKVTAVTEGNRYSAVTWASGPSFR